jgi:hypothetical protein
MIEVVVTLRGSGTESDPEPRFFSAAADTSQLRRAHRLAGLRHRRGSFSWSGARQGTHHRHDIQSEASDVSWVPMWCYALSHCLGG